MGPRDAPAQSPLHATAWNRVRESLRAVSSFLEIQEPWMQHMTRASNEGYYVEALSLALQHINVVLRKSLWLEAHLTLLRENKNHAERSSELLHLLHRPELLLPPLTTSGELYGAATESNLLLESEERQLMRLEEELPILQRNLFFATATPHEMLAETTRELLRLDRMCVRRLRGKTVDCMKLLNYGEP